MNILISYIQKRDLKRMEKVLLDCVTYIKHEPLSDHTLMLLEYLLELEYKKENNQTYEVRKIEILTMPDYISQSISEINVLVHLSRRNGYFNKNVTIGMTLSR